MKEQNEQENQEQGLPDERSVRQTRFLKGLIFGIGITFAVLFVFSLGVFVGEQKARFSYEWGRNYHRGFGGPPIGLGRPRGFFGGHGAFGVVLEKEAGKLLVSGPDNAEKIVLISKGTRLLSGRREIKLKAIEKGDRVLVVGSPDKKGRIKARLIRTFDPAAWKEPMWRRSVSPPPPPL